VLVVIWCCNFLYTTYHINCNIWLIFFTVAVFLCHLKKTISPYFTSLISSYLLHGLLYWCWQLCGAMNYLIGCGSWSLSIKCYRLLAFLNICFVWMFNLSAFVWPEMYLMMTLWCSELQKWLYMDACAVQKCLNQSICWLGCGLSWATGSTSSIVFTRWRQCALIGGHIGAPWRIQLNHLSVAAMRPYVKLLWPFVLFFLWFGDKWTYVLHTWRDWKVPRADEVPNTFLLSKLIITVLNILDSHSFLSLLKYILA